MGNASARPTTLPDSRAQFNSDLPKFALQTKFGKEGMLGDGKLMKSYMMRVDGTNVVVKVYMKLSDENLGAIQKRLHKIWLVLSSDKYPNLLPYQMWIRSPGPNAGVRQKTGTISPTYLIRQYLASNLYDRMLTRPFCTDIEKFWFIFQLLHCVEIVHYRDVVHGDIKPENVLCTNWNFLVLTDFAPHKPTLIPNDDPTDFQYFFDSSGRRSCYVAPERFVSREELDMSRMQSNKKKENGSDANPGGVELEPAMDVFSLGCTIAEIYLDSKTALLDLPTMLSYIVAKDGVEPAGSLDKHDSQAKSVLSRIHCAPLLDAIVHMTQRDPEQRLSVGEYLQALLGKQDSDAKNIVLTSDSAAMPPIFPSYFEHSLQPLFLRLHYEGVTPDRRVHILCSSYRDLIRDMVDKDDSQGHETLQNVLSDTPEAGEISKRVHGGGMSSDEGALREQRILENRQQYIEAAARIRPSASKTSVTNSSESLDAMSFDDLDGLMKRCNQFIDGVGEATKAGKSHANSGEETKDVKTPRGTSGKCYEDFFADVNTKENDQQSRVTHVGLVILVQLVTSNYRHLQTSQGRIASILVLLRIGSMCDDDVIIKRILPTLLIAMEDMHSSQICSLALRTVASLLSLVQNISVADEEIFPTYIVPAMNRILRVHDVTVRMSFAATMGVLAESSKRFLDRVHFHAQRKATRVNEPGGLKRSTSMSELPPPPPNGKDGGESMPQPGEGDGILVDFQYTKKLQDLRDIVAQWVTSLLSDSSHTQGDVRRGSGLSSSETLIKREFLCEIERLCVFFGQDMVIPVLLPHLLTFFSDHDWELRLSFWEKIPTICAFIGPSLTEAYILPGIDHGLVDCEECIVAETVECLASLCKMRLLSLPVLVDYADERKAAALLLHPSAPVREAASGFLLQVSGFLGPQDASVFLVPRIQKFFSPAMQWTGPITSAALRAHVYPPLSYKQFRKNLLARHQALVERRAANHPGHMHVDSVSVVANEEDESGRRGIVLMGQYIDHAAIELNTKISQWRHALHGSLYSSPYATALRRCSTVGNYSSAGTLDALLNLSANAQFHSQTLKTLMVPHQKFGAGFYYPLTEEQRFLCTKLDAIRDPDVICALFGMGSNRYEAEKALSLADKDDLLATKRDGDDANSNGNNSEQMFDRPEVSSIADSQRTMSLKKRIKALGIPPLPPDVGSLLQPNLTDDKRLQYYNGYTDTLDLSSFTAGLGNASSGASGGNATGVPSGSSGGSGRIGSVGGGSGLLGRDNAVPSWKPKEGVLMCSLNEHTGATNRIAICPDQSFLSSASSDGTVKIWQLRGIDSTSLPTSSLTYKRHRSPVKDVTVIENSHSMASCSEDGTIHVWRVDVDGKVQLNSTSNADDIALGADPFRNPGLGVAGMGVIKAISADEGPIEALQHFNGDVASVLTYVTRDKGLHGWDLRSSQEAFSFTVRPELGSSTAMTVAPDRSWVIVGTSRGYIGLWDLRYNVLCKLWQHSSMGPINRLACCKSLQQATNAMHYPTSSPSLSDTEGSYLFVAAGNGETSIFGLPEAGECLKCFRSVPLSKSRESIAALPVLYDVPVTGSPSTFLLPSTSFNRDGGGGAESVASPSRVPTRTSPRDNAVRAMVGRTPVYLITAGSDSIIRYWDFSSPAKCLTVAGLMPGQPKSIYEAPTDEGLLGRLFLSFDSVVPSADTTLPQHLPLRGGRGPIVPSNAFKDAILDLKCVDIPTRALISSAKDGTIKLWR
jgi:phosphoinositide-3-kinase regulatory subunit 4